MLIALLVSLGLGSLRAEDVWTNDFEAAKARARAEDKDVLIAFTAERVMSSHHLKESVLDTPEFQAAATKHFVFVELEDYRGSCPFSEFGVALFCPMW